MAKTAPARPYHHGNLRRALLDAALEELAEHGPQDLSLRALARRAGVSHAAPAHHFGDKAGLLTAMATEGYELLAESLAGADRFVVATAASGNEFLAQGLSYIDFAVRHPAHFEVMFRPDLHHHDDPTLLAAKAATTRMLYGAAELAFPDDPFRVGIAGWSWAHGFASLWVSGSYGRGVGHDDPIELARSIGEVLFRLPD